MFYFKTTTVQTFISYFNFEIFFLTILADHSRAKRVEKRFEDNCTTTDAETPTSSKFRTRLQRAELKEKRRSIPIKLVAVDRRDNPSSSEDSASHSPNASDDLSDHTPSHDGGDNILQRLKGTKFYYPLNNPKPYLPMKTYTATELLFDFYRFQGTRNSRGCSPPLHHCKRCGSCYTRHYCKQHRD